MRSKSFIAVLGFVAVLLVAAVGVYAYDSTREDLIAEGITIGGVDVGGMRAADARRKLHADLLTPLSRPIVARYHGRRFTLTPERARVGVDVDRSVAAAVQRSREGGFIARTVRDLTGGHVRQALDVRISYDRDAVDRMVSRVRHVLDREAVDAGVSFDGGVIDRKPAKSGREVVAGRLKKAITRRLTSTTAPRTVGIAVRTVRPKVTTADLADKYPTVVIVNRNAFTLRLYKSLREFKSYRVAVGMAGLETPQGLYSIQDKQVDPYWHVPQSDWAGKLAGKVIPPGPTNPIKARWMGIYNGAGIHGTDAIGSLGTAASHGCIRMAIPDVEDLFERVDVGTPVYIL
jgi:lipoprotein-anchoring transpeptidase ErfK/SrfK